MIRRGFTLIEIAITLAIVAIVAAITVAAFGATRRNTSLDGSAMELLAQAQGLRFTAMSEQVDHLFVVVSPTGNNYSGCSTIGASGCLRTFVLRNPQAGWNVSAFDPAAPGTLAELVDSSVMPLGTMLDLAAAGTAAPPPFQSVTAFAPDVTATCAGGRRCIAIRFGANGEVRPEFAAAPGATRIGVVIGLTTDLLGQSSAAKRLGLLVSFPSGITRSFPY